jgi:hypothetical protein
LWPLQELAQAVKFGFPANPRNGTAIGRQPVELAPDYSTVSVESELKMEIAGVDDIAIAHDLHDGPITLMEGVVL